MVFLKGICLVKGSSEAQRWSEVKERIEKTSASKVQWTRYAMERYSIFHASHTTHTHTFFAFPICVSTHPMPTSVPHVVSMFCYLSKMCVNAYSIHYFFFACNQIVLYFIVFCASRGRQSREFVFEGVIILTSFSHCIESECSTSSIDRLIMAIRI